MKSRFIVTYDVSDPKRLRQVYKTMRGYGQHLQLSVFRCDLSETERVVLAGILSGIIDHQDDQVLFIHVGPSDGRGEDAIAALGRSLLPARRPVVL